MHSVTVIILLPFAVQANSNEQANKYMDETWGQEGIGKLVDKTVDKLIDKLFDRALQASPLGHAASHTARLPLHTSVPGFTSWHAPQLGQLRLALNGQSNGPSKSNIGARLAKARASPVSYGSFPVTGTLAEVAEQSSGQVQEVHSEKDLEQYIRESPRCVVLEFVCKWCKPCRKFDPKYERIAAEYSGQARFLKAVLNCNEETYDLASFYGVKSIPYFYFIKDGEVVAEKHSPDETNLRSTLNGCLSK